MRRLERGKTDHCHVKGNVEVERDEWTLTKGGHVHKETTVQKETTAEVIDHNKMLALETHQMKLNDMKQKVEIPVIICREFRTFL